MELQSTCLFIPLNKSEMKTLVADVKETLSKDCIDSREKRFSTTDLWRIHRNKRKVKIRTINEV